MHFARALTICLVWFRFVFLCYILFILFCLCFFFFSLVCLLSLLFTLLSVFVQCSLVILSFASKHLHHLSLFKRRKSDSFLHFICYKSAFFSLVLAAHNLSKNKNWKRCTFRVAYTNNEKNNVLKQKSIYTHNSHTRFKQSVRGRVGARKNFLKQ